MLFGWLTRDPNAPTAPVIAAMRRALRAGRQQEAVVWCEAGFGIGAFAPAPLDRESEPTFEPAVASQRYYLWFAGEAFAWPSHGGATAAESGTQAFRQRLLEAYLRVGPAALRDLDGEYHVAIWDRTARRLVLFNDRFAALPMYWAQTPQGVAFAGGVRGVLMAPDARVEPDLDAIREAVTFGGFRLGSRTNVRGVAMLAGSTALASDGARVDESRYWRWAEIPPVPTRALDDIVSELRAEWTRAITARLAGVGRVGLTLSGGLDSRAILAESVRHAPVHAVTYGVPESDDVRIARRAARAADARWTFAPLYRGEPGAWLERRTSHIQATDGLMELVDLMHLETIDSQVAAGDLSLSGYIGDVVVGPTYNHVQDAGDAVLAMPYYGGVLGLEWDQALERVAPLVAALMPAPARFTIVEHKLRQAINAITAALRPYLRVRRPFVDYRVFELAQGQPAVVRGEQALHDRWLLSTYPHCFARIPHQKTGVPPLTPVWRREATRALRYAWRRGLTALRDAGLPVVPPRRSFHDDERYWRQPAARDRIEAAILRPGSLAAEVFGRTALEAVVSGWFERLAAPSQVIGALYVYETYHRDLAPTLRAARAVAMEDLCSSSAR